MISRRCYDTSVKKHQGFVYNVYVLWNCDSAPKPTKLGKGKKAFHKPDFSSFRGAACGSLDGFSDVLLIFPKER